MDEPPEIVILPWLAGWLPGDGAPELESELSTRLANPNLRIAATEQDARKMIRTANIVITNALSADLLDECNELEWIQTVGVGVDKYPLDSLRSKGVLLTNAAGVSAEPIAEQVLGYIVMFERQLHRGLRQQYETRWERYTAGELRGKTLGIIGVGSIGSRVAELGSAVGMTVIGSKRNPDRGGEMVDEVVGADGVHRLLPRSDYLVVACPLTEQTTGLLGRSEFAAMKSSAVVVNIARGEIVDEAALCDAVRNKRLRGAALDVFEEEPLPADSPLWGLSNVIITPHMGGSTPYYWERLGDIFADNYQHFVTGDTESLRNKIDLNT